MDFSYSGQQPHGPGGPLQLGPDLEEIETDSLGFLGLGVGQAKVQLLPESWTANGLPPPTASLLSVASQNKLLAAAGPQAVVVAGTDSVRKAFEAVKSGESEIRPFKPELTLPMPMRISQIAFTSDERFLLLSAEVGGGLAVYDVQSLLQGSTQSAFEMSTNSQALRALVPNPATELGEIVAMLTVDGNVMITNLREKRLVPGIKGEVLIDRASCVAWSNRGKQLIAGLGDGSAYQMTPDGTCKDVIPSVPNMDPSMHVSSITWLENDVFLIIHSPSVPNGDSAFPSAFHIVTRTGSSEFIFQKIGDPTPPYGLPRNPPHHFLLRLKKFPPKLQDLLIVASTASTDIGLFSRSALDTVSDKPTDKDTSPFTMTLAEDARRAQLSITDDMMDTSPIGVALDFSSTEKVDRPIPMDELDQSPLPVPALMVLNNEGVLASWWVIYDESIKQGTLYPGMVVAGGAPQPRPSSSTQQASQFSSSANSASRQPLFGTPANSTGGLPGLKPTVPAIGSTSFLGTNRTSAFGGPSALNQTTSPWSAPTPNASTRTASTFGVPASASTTATKAQGLAFGSSAFPGLKASPWGSAPTNTAGGGTLAQSGTFGSNLGGGVTNLGIRSATTVPASGGFASFANQGGFATVAPSQSRSVDLFSQPPAPNNFASSTASSKLVSDTSFGGNQAQENGKPGGLFGGSGFTLGTTFKPDGSAKDDGPRPSATSGMSLFGEGLGAAIGQIEKAPSGDTSIVNDANMDADEPESSQKFKEDESSATEQALSPVQESLISTTPVSTPAPKAQLPAVASFAKARNPSIPQPPETQPTKPESSKSVGFNFGTPLASAHKNPEGAYPKSSPLVPAQASSDPVQIKQEPSSDDEVPKIVSTIPEAPLPPDSTSKSSYAVGESSVSSMEPDAPLPPDFTSGTLTKTTQHLELPLSNGKKAEAAISPEETGGPAEEHDSDFETENYGDVSGAVSEEGSGEDVAKDVSPISGTHQTPGFTPQSSFGGANNRGTGGSFFQIPQPSQGVNSRALFGEIDSGSVPIIPPPKSFPSPRSPSPVRGAVPSLLLRPDTSRSVSAPGVASKLLGSYKPLTNRPVAPLETRHDQNPEKPRKSLRPQFEQSLRDAAKEAQGRADEEARALIDDEDESIQNFLQQDIVGTKILNEFVAHQDYVAKSGDNGIPAQVEAVYRDINSMIDILGINSCSLKSFVQGHEELCKRPGRTRKDLEDEEEWCLAELRDISTIIEQDLTVRLNEGRVQDVAGKLLACADVEKDLAKLRPKYADIKTLIASHLDPDHMSMARSQPLKAAQALQQHDLRRDFAKFQRLLTEAEECVTMLRTKLATQGNANGKALPGPTVEAVMRTISKMTSMAEKRSGDVDVLETQMRKLRLSPSTKQGVREASPFTTPAGKASMRNPGLESTHSGASSLFQTPDSRRLEDPRGFHNSVSSSVYSPSRPPRRKMNGFKEEDRQQLRREEIRKRELTGKLRGAVGVCGVQVRPLDYDD